MYLKKDTLGIACPNPNITLYHIIFTVFGLGLSFLREDDSCSSWTHLHTFTFSRSIRDGVGEAADTCNT